MLYVATTFLSAFLLFMVQPMMGKLLLPWFGGAPAVWTTCMLFYQVALLLGYAYAHLLGSRLEPRTQARLHVGLLLLAGAAMLVLQVRWGSPVLPDDAWKPTGLEAPVPLILLLLLLSIGLPYALLSATSPLLQRWFSLAGHGDRTYRLYAVSNVGSLLGLLSYPLVTERFLSLPVQANVWALAFVVFAVGCAVCALQLQKQILPPAASAATRPTGERPEALTILCWLLLAASTSAMLLAVTNQLCQEVAPVPFLWVLPLAIYLLTFIICFDRPQWYRRRVFVPVTVLLTLLVLITAFAGVRLNIPVHVVVNSAFLFAFCMTCHGELVGLKPPSEHLTFFYLIIALGGALGGVFVGLLAPLWFTSYWEFNIMATLSWVVLAVVFARDRGSFFYQGDRWHFALLVFILTYTVLRMASALAVVQPRLPGWMLSLSAAAIAGALATMLLLWLTRRAAFPASRYWPRVLVGTVIFLAECFMVVRINATKHRTLAADRNFFGTLQVQVWPARAPVPPFVQLTHGQINHGIQYLDATLGRLPVSYYGPGSGIETAILQHPRRRITPAHPAQPLHIGVLGLGTGTMAAFARPGDQVRFYEINPVVIRYASGPQALFSYLHDCSGAVEIVQGDARLAMERELAGARPQRFDVLVMDAFSSDSVPVHLLTREAFRLYARHLRDEDSIIAVNISNRFLDFRDLIATTAREMGCTAMLVEVRQTSLQAQPSSWMLVTRSPAFITSPEVQKLARVWQPRRDLVWTDDFSNLLHLLR
jgi:spermidine synthase